MAKIEDGVSGAILAAVENGTKAVRTTRRAPDAAGFYRLSVFSGLTTGIAGAGEVFQFRWTDSSKLALLHFLRVRAQVITGFTAQQEIAFDVSQVTGFTVAGTGGTQILPTATNLMQRTTFPQSVLNEARISTTAALGAGTKSFFGTSFLSAHGVDLAAAATVQRGVIEGVWREEEASSYPIVLAQNEGFAIRNTIAQGAAGVVRWLVEANWSEIAAY